MTLSKDLTRIPAADEPLIMVYRDKIRFSWGAVRLLSLDRNSRVAFKVTTEEHPQGAGKVYVGKRKESAYRLLPSGRRYTIANAGLSRSLADALEGCGTYRIEKDYTDTDSFGNVYHLIFWRKLE
ncbi:MAG: hypothetical protein MJZ12_00050 [Prevotella sp.]|nr:hypothetical protein [Prevotella sp.]